LPQGLWKDAERVHFNNYDLTNIRWTPLQNLHITLFFLGEVQPFNLDKIKGKIRNEVSTHSPFSLRFEKISLQKGRKDSGMIWMKFLKDEMFSSLSDDLRKCVEEFLLHEARMHDSIPHITLARWKGSIDHENFNFEFNESFQLPEISFYELWQSVSSAGGVIYKSLKRFEMRKT
jgi:2'-5' RNA ligase